MLQQLLILSLTVLQTSTFSIPGVSTKSYAEDEIIPVYANELDSVDTQLKFEYYYLKYIQADNTQHIQENLGSVLLGETTQLTPYKIRMQNNMRCEDLGSIILDRIDADNFKWMIDKDYYMNLVIDNLPAISRNDYRRGIGIPVGFKDNREIHYINNHLDFIVEYSVDQDIKRVVAFNAAPKSYAGENGKSFCQNSPESGPSYSRKPPQIVRPEEVFYTYSVLFKEVKGRGFGSRWDNYKRSNSDRIHWLSIMNSLVINTILIAVIYYIFKKRINNNVTEYNELRNEDDIQEGRGWNRLSMDVFRPPGNALLFSVLIGTGVQVFLVLLLTILFTYLGFMIESSRGEIIKLAILMYNITGIFAGYSSARAYKLFEGDNWKKCALLTAVLYPALNFIVFFSVNFVFILEGSSNALHTSTIFTLVFLWLCISSPLVLLGSFLGYRSQASKDPHKYNPIPKDIGPQPWYVKRALICSLGGLLPFGCIFIELAFIFMSVWRHQLYYFFVFLLIVLLLLVLTTAEISLIITYMQLEKGSHNIWWNSFLSTGSIGLYVFAYSIFYWHTALHMSRFSSVLLYFAYMLAVSAALSLLCGAVGFVSSYLFVKRIYSRVNAM